MGTKRGLERIIFFTDAVVAIAITLLVLPLVEIVPQSVHNDVPSVASVLSNHIGQIGAFVLSFAVIARLWVAHHAIFEHVNGYNRPLVMLTLSWAFTIVLLPLPTAFTAVYSPNRATVAMYIGVMTVNSLLLTVITLLVRGNPKLEVPEYPVPSRQLASSLVTCAAFILALILGVSIPGVTYWGLLLIALSGPLVRPISKWVDRHPRVKRET
jgi:uncharacterized membrane protein